MSLNTFFFLLLKTFLKVMIKCLFLERLYSLPETADSPTLQVHCLHPAPALSQSGLPDSSIPSHTNTHPPAWKGKKVCFCILPLSEGMFLAPSHPSNDSQICFYISQTLHPHTCASGETFPNCSQASSGWVFLLPSIALTSSQWTLSPTAILPVPRVRCVFMILELGARQKQNSKCLGVYVWIWHKCSHSP